MIEYFRASPHSTDFRVFFKFEHHPQHKRSDCQANVIYIPLKNKPVIRNADHALCLKFMGTWTNFLNIFFSQFHSRYFWTQTYRKDDLNLIEVIINQLKVAAHMECAKYVSHTRIWFPWKISQKLWWMLVFSEICISETRQFKIRHEILFKAVKHQSCCGPYMLNSHTDAIYIYTCIGCYKIH